MPMTMSIEEASPEFGPHSVLIGLGYREELTHEELAKRLGKELKVGRKISVKCVAEIDLAWKRWRENS